MRYFVFITLLIAALFSIEKQDSVKPYPDRIADLSTISYQRLNFYSSERIKTYKLQRDYAIEQKKYVVKEKIKLQYETWVLKVLLALALLGR